LQGEVVGYGIQSNMYGLKGQDIFIFNIFDITKQRYLPVAAYRTILDNFALKGVPVVAENFPTGGFDHARFLEYAEGKSFLNSQAEREGVVIRSIDETRSNQGKISFKAIFNKYLLKHGGYWITVFSRFIFLIIFS
jgi:ATP-dependent RNA circularization protein (DNA/RNA ligase family)